MRSKGSSDRKPRLTPAQEEDLAQAILDGPKDAGYLTAVWTLPRLTRLIQRRYGARYHPGHVWHLLDRMGAVANVSAVRR